jgi:hypothetical protein
VQNNKNNFIQQKYYLPLAKFVVINYNKTKLKSAFAEILYFRRFFMKTLKKTLSLILSVCLIASIFAVAAVTVSANYGDEEHNKNIVDCVKSTSTKTLRFYMPQEWRNAYNDTYDGQDLATCSAGIYWWEGSDNCELAENQARGKGWPGYTVTETDPDCANVFVAKVPDDVTTIIWNNSVNGPEKYEDDPDLYQGAMQIENTSSEYFMPGEDVYGFYPEGTDDFDGMIYVCNLKDTTINEYNGKMTFKGCLFYYYGQGKYGVNKEPVEGQVFENGEWPGGETPEETTVDPSSTEETTAASGEETTAAPGEETTAAPGEDTTVAPGEDEGKTPQDTTEPQETTVPATTAAPQETTAAPQGTTAAPAKPAVTPVKKVLANTAKISAKKVTVKAKKAKKKAVTVKPIKVKNAKGAVSYKVAKKDKKKVLKLKKNGSVKVKKGAKKGTYKMTVTVSVKGNANYAPVKKNVKVTVKVK